MSQKLSHDAVEWYVLNESGTAQDVELGQRWEQWCVKPGNRAEYVFFLELAQDLRSLPPPTNAGWKELLMDVAAEVGESGISRAG